LFIKGKYGQLHHMKSDSLLTKTSVKIIRYLAIPLGISLALSTLSSFDPGVLWGLIWFICIPTWALRRLYKFALSPFRKSFAALVQHLTVLVLGLSILFFAFLFAGDYIHLAIMYPHYYEKIKGTSEMEHSFEWGGSGFAGYGMIRVLIYSPSSTPNFDEAKYQAEMGGSPPIVNIKHLIGSFYVKQMYW